MSSDDVLKGIYNQEVMDERKAAGMLAYEERIVKKILIRIGLEKEIGRLCMLAKEKTGKARLTFTWFYEEYPSFPCYLGMRKVPFAFQVTVKDLFNKFCSTAMFKAWEELRDEAPVEIEAGAPVGLIFDWPGVKGTQMVLHNWQPRIYHIDDNLRFIRNVGKGNQLVAIEQFDPFFEHVMTIWVP